MIWLIFVGCSEETVRLTGNVFESHDLLSGPLEDGELAIVDFDGKPLATAETDANGAFEAVVPAGIAVFVEVTAEGFAVTAFPGVIGLDPEQEVEAHALYGVSDAERADWLGRFTGCPGADDDRAMVIGEMRIYGLQDPYTGESPTIGTGTVAVAQGEDVKASGCYLDEDGALYDPEAEVTGASGAFGVFGVGPGLHDLQIEGEVSTDLSTTQAYPLWVPDRPNVVSPWFPAWLPFAF
jgi:hypothetical protein